MHLAEMAKAAKVASKKMMALDHQTRGKILTSIALSLENHRQEILMANQLDILEAQEANLSNAMTDRLLLDDNRIDNMITAVKEIASQPEVVNEIFEKNTRYDGLIVAKQRIPLGVILMIFESRPNVVVDCAALAIKSSNAIILKGGKEAKHSNEILGKIIRQTISDFIPENSVVVLASDQREHIDQLLSMNKEIDLVIPRGGEKLIQHVYSNSKIPVIAHFQGICHIYIDKDANMEKAISIVVNAKTQRPGVCNAVETLIVHKDRIQELSLILDALINKKTELRLDSRIIQKLNLKNVKEADDIDWQTEYLSNILSIKLVTNIEQAIEHIQKYGSHHSEAIITENKQAADFFIQNIDASCVLWNASTRFNDGGQLGLGAELGISTTKIHAYGPMGAEQMTTARYIVIGDGHIRL